MFNYVFMRGILSEATRSSYSAGRRYGCIEAPFYDWRCSFHIPLSCRCCGAAIAGINPVARQLPLVWVVLVEVRRHFKEQSELAVAIVMVCGGIGLAGVLSGFVPNSSSFNSFMFGYLTVSEQEVQMIVVISVLTVAFCFFNRKNFS